MVTEVEGDYKYFSPMLLSAKHQIMNVRLHLIVASSLIDVLMYVNHENSVYKCTSGLWTE